MNIIRPSKSKFKIAISWNELPAYGARVLRASIQKYGHPVTVIATTPQIPIKGMEDILGQKIYWINPSSIKSWDELGLEVPDIFFQAGVYYIKSFNKLGSEVRKNHGKVVLLSDNCWKKSFRQISGSILFRLIFKRKFAAVWVPGKSGETLMRIFGFAKNQIYQGLYGSDNKCFTPGPPLLSRPEQFIFVGKLTYLKGVHTLFEAFKTFNKTFPNWKIIIFGDGEYSHLLQNCPGIVVNPFAQPPQIAEAMRESRFLVLPTLTDHWPLVVSEASLAGCGLILSNKVGNALEFLNEKNGFSFKSKSETELTEKLIKAASLPELRLKEVYNESLRLGVKFIPETSADKFCKIISYLENKDID